ncbi:1-deoxy-D-xylulose-5-phosphate synthase [Toxoplasma gondii GT1]|uniref:1-deoxy-D-xylulose-5-phosphate synthase n=2 Tax=Toxoplasma gondii TaxID=5811 RepID=S7VS82_TOXGG|nr:1-deoxy-D-xylulose-5-phosphate synthase [Toxoplasma gondii GT1]KAF4645943.1 1-deoxy-D-xylulose-5-phosphate synthase [Toxoplasma gondii]
MFVCCDGRGETQVERRRVRSKRLRRKTGRTNALDTTRSKMFESFFPKKRRRGKRKSRNFPPGARAMSIARARFTRFFPTPLRLACLARKEETRGGNRRTRTGRNSGNQRDRSGKGDRRLYEALDRGQTVCDRAVRWKGHGRKRNKIYGSENMHDNMVAGGGIESTPKFRFAWEKQCMRPARRPSSETTRKQSRNVSAAPGSPKVPSMFDLLSQPVDAASRLRGRMQLRHSFGDSPASLAAAPGLQRTIREDVGAGQGRRSLHGDKNERSCGTTHFRYRTGSHIPELSSRRSAASFLLSCLSSSQTNPGSRQWSPLRDAGLRGRVSFVLSSCVSQVCFRPPFAFAFLFPSAHNRLDSRISPCTSSFASPCYMSSSASACFSPVSPPPGSVPLLPCRVPVALRLPPRFLALCDASVSSSACFVAPFLSPSRSPPLPAPLPPPTFHLPDRDQDPRKREEEKQSDTYDIAPLAAASAPDKREADSMSSEEARSSLGESPAGSSDNFPSSKPVASAWRYSPSLPSVARSSSLFERLSVPPLLPRRESSRLRSGGEGTGADKDCESRDGFAGQDLLSSINLPVDLKRLPSHLLPQLCEEIRQEILRVVSQLGGHLASSLGMVEVIVALLRVLDVPSDRLVYDVSHQAYPHKILTGRRHMMGTLRQFGGLSGFCKRAESIYDPFGAGHSSTSISSVQGMAVARELLGQYKERGDMPLHVAVIGDGGLTGGMAYEALNACGYLKSKVLVILNDNQQVSLPTGTASAGGTAPAGAVSRHTQQLLQLRDFLSLKSLFRKRMHNTLLSSNVRRLSSLLQLFDGRQVNGSFREDQGSATEMQLTREADDVGVPRSREAEDADERKSERGRGKTEQSEGDVAREMDADEEESDQPKSHIEASFFEALGLDYLGPVDGHDVENLVAVLSAIKHAGLKGPTLLHVKTEKGHGYPPALAAADRLHGVSAGFSDHLDRHRVKREVSETQASSVSSSTSGLSLSASTSSSAPAVSKKHTSSTSEEAPSGQQRLDPPKKSPFLTSIAARALLRIAEDDRNVVGITAAMPGGTGLHLLGSRFPERMFDVGIAEQHAVTFAAGMAAEGLKPFCAIYSTFLQRAYDQIIHDAALQNLPVRFMIDRAGYVGPDGSTHQGSFDLAYLGCIPNLVVMAPSDELELLHMVETAYRYDAGPSAVRYGRAPAYGVDTLNNFLGHSVAGELPERGEALEIGKGRIVREADPAARHKVAILSLGTRLLDAVRAAHILEKGVSSLSDWPLPCNGERQDTVSSDRPALSAKEDQRDRAEYKSNRAGSRGYSGEDGSIAQKEVGVTVADARFLAPLDRNLLRSLAKNHEVLLVVEEGSIGGFGSHVLQALSDEGLLDSGKLKVRSLTMPHRFMEAGTPQQQYEDAGLTANHFVAAVRSVCFPLSSLSPSSGFSASSP